VLDYPPAHRAARVFIIESRCMRADAILWLSGSLLLGELSGERTVSGTETGGPTGTNQPSIPGTRTSECNRRVRDSVS
jgi:hypothetical protein